MAPTTNRAEHFDALVVGSGFGGSVAAARLAAAGLGVLVLERGRAYPPGSFPRDAPAMQTNVWDPSAGRLGLFDVRRFDGFDAVVASGLGGGSLIDANVMLRKDEGWFVGDDGTSAAREPWPITRTELDPHYDRVERVLRTTTYPLGTPPYDRTSRAHDLRAAASRLGLPWFLPRLAVAFGNDAEAPVPGVRIRETRPNLHHIPRQSCRLCGECTIGCNYGSKNTLDFTYLTAAGHDGAEIRTLREAREISRREGSGWTVAYVSHEHPARPRVTVSADTLVLSAGTFGTPLLLLRNRAALPALSRRLGTGFSTNGDATNLVARHARPEVDARGAGRDHEPDMGPVITCAIRHGGGAADATTATSARGGYLQDIGHPHGAAAFAAPPPTPGTPLASRLLTLLGMGLDVPDGTMSLHADELQVHWNAGHGSRAYFEGLREAMRELAHELGGTLVEDRSQRTLVAHPLGGARMGASAAAGVVDAWGRVHGCPGLYIADGSVMPGPVGANPALTIAALADRFSDAILDDVRRRRRQPHPHSAPPAPLATRAPGAVRGARTVRAEDLPALLRAAQKQLTEHLMRQMRSDGAMHAPCESRVAESALLLALLRRERLLPGAQASLRTFLTRRAAGATLFDATLVDALLTGQPTPDPGPIIDRVLTLTDDSGDDRERLVLSAILAGADAAPFIRHVSPAAFDARGESRLTALPVVAITMLYRAEFGRIDDADVDRLLGLLHAGQRHGVWEQQVLTHELALLALARARPGHPEIRAGIARVTTAANTDGGMPFIVSKSNFATATAGVALARAETDPGVLTAMADFLVEQQHPDGGWPLTEGAGTSDVDSTSFAVLFLHRLSPSRYSDTLSRARGYLRSMADPTGGFPVFRGAPADSWMTASAMLALAPRSDEHQAVLAAGASFLLDQQRPHGTFGRGFSLSEAASTFVSLLALHAATGTRLPALEDRARAATTAARRRLLGTANADGGWGHTPSEAHSDPISTAYSLVALAHDHQSRTAVSRAVAYLVAQQRPHGGYVCRPDQVGPRPLPYDIPILADNFVLLAMTYASAGLRAVAG